MAEETVKPKRGRGGTQNFPNAKFEAKTEAEKQVVRQLLNETLHEYRKPRVTSDKELAERLDEYFAQCAATGQTPSVEEMCLSTGYTSDTCWDWEVGRNKGFSSETSAIIKKAKNFLKTFDAKMAIAGQMGFLVYCFRAKNYYGMTDQKEVVITPAVEATVPQEVLEERYRDVLGDGTIDTTGEEVKE